MSDRLELQLWQYLDRQRGKVCCREYLRGWLEGGRDFRERRERLLTWLATAGAGHRREEGEFVSSCKIEDGEDTDAELAQLE